MSRSFERLLVAGGAGFIGSNFVRHMRRTHPETEILVLDKLTYAGNRSNLAEFFGTAGFGFEQGDICDRTLVDRLAAEVDAIVNFAAETHVDRSLVDPFSFVQTDVYGTAVLCDAARRHQHPAFLLVSTDEVYGHVPEGRSTESDPLLPRSPYSASKAGGEMLARSYFESFGLPLLVTRGSNTYGPYQYPEKIIPLFITNAVDGMPLPVYGDGTAMRDYIYVEDHCRAIDWVLHNGDFGEIYNVGTGRETNGLQVAETILKLAGKPRELLQFVKDRPGHDYRYALDVRKLQGLGWQPEVGWAEGMQRTVSWYRENESWWRPLRSGEYWEFYRANYQPVEANVSGSSAAQA